VNGCLDEFAAWLAVDEKKDAKTVYNVSEKMT